MGKMPSYLAMKTDPAGTASEAAQALIQSDLRELGAAASKLANHAIPLGASIGFGSTLFKWLAFIAAVYLLVLDKTNWKTNILTGLLVPYIFFTLPAVLFNLISLFADRFRNDIIGVGVCLVIGCYLLQEHINASGGFRAAFRQAKGVSNTIGIVLLFVYPVWAFVLYLL